jgi:hypothetical protein
VAPYAVRVQAAQLLSGRNRAGNLGSAELNLLARESVPVSEAQKAYFTAARIAAAKTATVPQRVTLLREVVAEAPLNGSARIALVNAAIEAKDAHLAISAAKPLLGENVLATVTYGETPPDLSSDADQAPEDGEMYGTPESFQLLSKADRVAILSGVAESYLKIDEPASALALLRQALRLEPDAARRKIMQTEIARLRRYLARRATNAARAPLIHATLDQNHPVRPRMQVAQEGVEQ